MRLTPFHAWMALAAAMTAAGGVEAAFTEPSGVPAALALGAAVAVAWWRPMTALVLAVVVAAIQAPLGDALYDLSLPVYCLAALTAMVAGREQGRHLAAGIALSVATLAVVVGPATESPAGDVFFASLFLIGLPALAGRAFRERTRLNTELRERARRLAADRQARADEAAAQERRRIAGELHDLVAHGVSGMTVQAEAARRLVRNGDPRAAEAIQAVEHGGREALAELRRLLGVLRRDDADLALAPLPSLDRVGALVDRWRAEGREIRLEIEGERGPLSPGVDVAGYRIVEEALRSAPDEPATVVIRYGARHIDVLVSGSAPAGLVALRERVRLFGGDVTSDRRGLRAQLPVSGAAA